ncbi:MAG TPA: hypothetical protein VNZ26_25760 [Vicinamibacterales bacterium]|nr:hypothetical protein [Vicinamibacterales bacterium]
MFIHFDAIDLNGRRVEGDQVEGHGLRPEVEALARDVGAQLVDVSGDVQAYWRLLRDLWAAGNAFIVVEHDVLPTQELLEAMWVCPEAICTGNFAPCDLQCVKFSAGLIQQFPTLFDDIGPHSWQGLDMAIQRSLDRNLPVRYCNHGGLFGTCVLDGQVARRHLHHPQIRHLSVETPPSLVAFRRRIVALSA